MSNSENTPEQEVKQGEPLPSVGGASRQECAPNITGEGPRREFASDTVWKERVKAEFLSALDSLLLRFGGELGVEINGDACADIQATLSEYVTVGGEPSYFYCTLDLGSCYMPPRAEVAP